MPKEDFIALRTRPEIKKLLTDIAKQEYRSLSQQCEMILIEWLKKHNHLKKYEKKTKE